MSTLVEMYLEGKRIAEDIKIDYANRLLAIVAQQDQDERSENAAVTAYEPSRSPDEPISAPEYDPNDYPIDSYERWLLEGGEYP